MDYKPLCDFARFDAIIMASFVSGMLWVLIISAPLITDMASAATDPNILSEGSSLPRSLPINDLLDTETKTG